MRNLGMFMGLLTWCYCQLIFTAVAVRLFCCSWTLDFWERMLLTDYRTDTKKKSITTKKDFWARMLLTELRTNRHQKQISLWKWNCEQGCCLRSLEPIDTKDKHRCENGIVSKDALSTNRNQNVAMNMDCRARILLTAYRTKLRGKRKHNNVSMVMDFWTKVRPTTTHTHTHTHVREH